MVARKLKFLFSEEFLVIFLSLILIGFSYGPLVYHYLTPPPGKIFLGSVGFPPDFFGNLTSFQEGRLGHWEHFSKMTSIISGPPTLMKFDYHFLGQLSRLFPFESIIFFHLSRLTLSVIFLLVSYILIARVFKEKYQRLLAFSLALFSTSTIFKYNRLIDLWSPLSVFQRTAYYPHYLFSFIFVLLSLIFLAQSLTLLKPKALFLASFFNLLAGWIHPPVATSLFLTLPFYVILTLLRKPSLKIFATKVIYLLVFVTLSSLSLVYFYIVRNIHPWNLVAPIDIANNLTCCIKPTEFVTGIGPTLILALLGGFLAIKKGDNLSLLLAPWSVVYILGFWFLWKITYSNSARFIQTPFFIILGILSFLFIDYLSGKIFPKSTKNRQRMAIVLTIFVLLLSIPGWSQGLSIAKLQTKMYYYVYISPEFIQSLKWLSQNTKEKDFILSENLTGMFVAAFPGNIPYWSLFSGGLDFDYTLKNNTLNFLCQKWSNSVAFDFLKKENIKLVFWGPREKELCPNNSLNYPSLNKVFQNAQVVIYKTAF